MFIGNKIYFKNGKTLEVAENIDLIESKIEEVEKGLVKRNTIRVRVEANYFALIDVSEILYVTGKVS